MKPLVNRKNQKAMLTFAEEHVGWREENWSKFHFSDESKFNWFGLGLRGNILFGMKLRKERLNLKCVMKSVKGGGRSAIVWGCFLQQELDLIQLHGKVNANIIRTSFSNIQQFLPYKHLPISLQKCAEVILPFILISDSCNSSKC